MRLMNLLNPASRSILMLAGVTLFTQAAVAQGGNVDSAALIDKYCTKCHNSTDWAGSTDLEEASAASLAEDPQVDPASLVHHPMRNALTNAVGALAGFWSTCRATSRWTASGSRRTAGSAWPPSRPGRSPPSVRTAPSNNTCSPIRGSPTSASAEPTCAPPG